MSKTTLEMVNFVYAHLQSSALFTSINKPNGGLYRYQRPAGSAKEDVVVNSLTLNRAQIQRGMVNVNLFASNLTLTINGALDNSQPDTARFTELSLLADQALAELWDTTEQCGFDIQQDHLHQDEHNQHYLNFRVNFYALNPSIH